MLVKLALLICIAGFLLKDVVSTESPPEVKIPGVCTPDWVDLLSGKSKNEDVIAKHDVICVRLANKVKKKSYFSVKDRKRVCACACHDVLAENECFPDELTVSDFNLTAVASSLMEWSVTDDPEVLPEDGLDDWLDALRRIFPLVLSLIPVIIRGLDVKFGYSHCGMMLLVLTIMFSFVDMTSIQIFYIVLVTFVSMVDNGRAGVFPEVVGSAITIIVFVGFGLITSPLYQIGFTIVTIIVYIATVISVLSGKNRRTYPIPGVLVMVASVCVFYEQLIFMRGMMRTNTLALDVFEMCLNSVVFNSESSFASKSILRLSKGAASHLFDMNNDVNTIHAFLGFNLLQIIGLFAVRSLLGVFVVLSMRYKREPRNLSLGFVVYCSDLYGGLIYLISGFLDSGKIDSRRALYSLLNVYFVLVDMNNAVDFFMLRVVICVLDKFVFQTNYGELPKYLKADMAESSFPQEGSHPWVAMRDIMTFSERVVRLTVEDGNKKAWSGLGFLRNNGVCTSVYTVAHVLCNYHSLKYESVGGGEKVISSRNENNGGYDVSDEYDPVSFAQVGSECKGASVRPLDASETKDVNSLFFIKLDAYLEPLLCWVSNFRFDKENRIRASIDLEKGNSGGPAFAVLKNGGVRYAGATSAGESSGRNGNHISCVCQDEAGTERVFGSDTDSIGSERGNTLRAKASTKKKVLSNDVDSLNKKVQSLHDQLVGRWYADASKDGNEVTWVDNHDDIVGRLEQGDDIDPPKDCEEVGKQKKRKKKKLISLEHKSKIYEQFRDIWSEAELLLGVSNAEVFIRDVRCGFKPHVVSDGEFAEFVPTSRKKVLFEIDEIKPKRRIRKSAYSDA